MHGLNSGKNEEKRKKLPQRTYRTICSFFVCLLIIIILSTPVNKIKAATISKQGTITLTGVVPFRAEFAEAVSKNSKISFDRTIIFSDQNTNGTVIFSNGETVLKNQKFICEILTRKGETEVAYQGQSGKDGIGQFTFKISAEMIGENIIKCQATGYEQSILVDQQIKILALPSANEALNFFIR